MKIYIYLLLTIVFSPNIFGQNLNKVGMTVKMYSDENRKNWSGTADRPLLITVWYPSNGKSDEKPIVIGNPANPIFISGKAARDAELSSSRKRFPLIILSHGTGGSALQMMWLGEFLAARGFIIAAVDHHGNTGAEEKPAAQGFVLWWERATDLKVVIDKMLTDSKFAGHIDSKRIGAAGFSLGGATVTALAGGIFSLDMFDKFCASSERDSTCDPQPEFPTARKEFEILKTKDPIVIQSLKQSGNSYKDSRIKAVFEISPALGGSFTPASLSAIKIPVQIVVGESDSVTPAKTNAQKIARHIKHSKLNILPGKTGHYTFLSECSPFGKTILSICRDQESVNRKQIHQEVSEMAFKFFQKHL